MSDRRTLAWLVLGIVATAAGCGGSIPAGDYADGGRSDAKSDAPATGSGGSVGLGTGGASAGSGGLSGSGGATIGDSGASDSPSDSSNDAADAASSCLLNLIPLSVPTLNQDIERGPKPFRVQAVASPAMDTDQWAWTITYPDNSMVHPPMVDGNPSVVEFPLTIDGSYNILVSITNRPLCAPFSLPIFVVDPRPTAFVFRVFPPPALGIPAQEVALTTQQLKGGLAPNAPLPPLNIYTRDLISHPLPTFVQITIPSSSLVVEANTMNGQVSVPLLPQFYYNLLLIPAGDKFAPKLFFGPPTSLVRADFSFDPGIAVSGQAQRSDGSPVKGARLVLRNGIRPSTVGTSDDGGAFSLLTREGPTSVDIAAPANAGLPDAHVDATGGIVVGSNDSGLMLTMQWAALDAGALKLNIHNTDGTTAAAGAAVYAELTTPIATAGQLTVHSPDAPAGTADLTLTASGSVRANAVADSQGAVNFTALTAGTYRLTITPPAGASADAATTSATLAVTTAGTISNVTIARKVKLSGALTTTSASSQGVNITAFDTGTDIVSTSSSAVVGADGTFVLTVAPGRSYKLWALPAAGQPFARSMIGSATAAAVDQTLPALTLPLGVRANAVVSLAVPIPKTLVQVFCPAASTTCLDTTLPVAEAVTGSDGSFSVLLPDTAAPAASAASR